MKAVISPSNIYGNVTASPSKSAMQRVCALALLHNGETLINNAGTSNDDRAALGVIKTLGAQVESMTNGSLLIRSNGNIKVSGEVNCGESGLSFRMFAPIAALSDKMVVLTGNGSLLNRKMDFLDTILPELGVEIFSSNGKIPVTIKGPLQPKSILIDASQSSQYLTGLLFAFAKSTHVPVSINVNNLKSKPYIDLSLEMLTHFGYEVLNKEYKQFIVSPVKIKKDKIIYNTEGDWSGAAFLLVAGAVAGNIKVDGLDIESAQADVSILNILEQCGACFRITDNIISVNNNNKLNNFNFDATDCPDLFPPIVVLAAYCNGISRIKGISRLRGKESDRALTLVEIFSKMGVKIEIHDDIMIIKGSMEINGADISSHHDHRIAMAGAIAALKANGNMVISNAEAVNKSYPGFYDHLKSLGAAVSLSE